MVSVSMATARRRTSSTDVSGEPPVVEVHDDFTEVVLSDVGEPGPSGPEGPQGPQGPQGPTGTTTIEVVGNLAYIWTQNDPLDTWLIQHNLGFFPAVTVVDSGGTTVEGTVRYIDDDAVEVTFTSAFGGNAYLS